MSEGEFKAAVQEGNLEKAALIAQKIMKSHKNKTHLLNISNQTLQAKKTDMQKTTWKPSSLSGGLGFVPVPGFSLVSDIAILVKHMTDYCKDFGLNSESLSALAKQVGKREEDLKAVIKCPLATEITPELVHQYIWDLAKTAGWGAKSLGYMARSFIPVIGPLIAAPVCYKTTMDMLDNFISDLAEDTQRVLEKALE